MNKQGQSSGLGDQAATPDAEPAEKHRLSARLKTRELARLSFPTERPMLCQISDFSRTGLQLSYLDKTEALPDLSSGPSTRVEIEFPLDRNGVGVHRLSGELVHASASSLGLKLDAMSRDAYQALIDARVNIAGAGGPVAGLLPEENQAILRDCLSLFHHFLDRVWRDFLDGIATRVAERNTGTLFLSDHSRYLGSLASLLHEGEETGRLLHANLVRQMHRMGEPRQPLEEPELAIVDDGSFEDWLNIAHVFNRIETDNRSEMFHFAQRFSRLTPVPIDRHNDPFGPETVCLAFQDTIAGFDLNNEMRGLVYKTFGEALGPRYPLLYEQLNTLLAPLKPARPDAAAKPEAAHPAEPAAAGPEISAQIDKLAAIAERLFALGPNDRPPPPEPVAAPAAAGPGDAAAWRDPARELERTLGHIAARLAPARVPQAVPRILPAPDLDQLLAGTPAAASLTQQVADLLMQADTAGLDAGQRESLGMATDLMGQAMAAHAEHSDLDALLKKLEKPLYELILRGDDPLNQVDHPLYKLLNLVDRFAIVTDDSGRFLDRDLGELLGTVIDRAVGTTAADAGAFARACEALEKLLKFPSQFHRQRVANHQDVCEAEQSIRSARLAVARLLDQRLAGRPIPRIVLNLLDQGLRQYLVQQSLRGNAQECLSSLRLLDILLDERRQGPQDAWLSAVETRLRAVNADRAGVEACLGALAGALAGGAGHDRVSLPAAWFVDETGLAKEAAATAPVEMPNRLGEWWDIGLDGRMVPMQLIWTSQPIGQLGFVNRSATRKLQLSLAELAEREAAGGFRRGEDRDLSLLERSENGTVDNLYRRLAHRAHHDPVSGLLNLKGFTFRAARQPHRSGKGHVVGVIEFAPFRAILDTCGVEAAGRLTGEVAAVLTRRVGAADLLAAAGDGRLALFLPDLDLDGARKVADRLAEALRDFQFRHADAQYVVETRIGLAGLVPGVADAGEALRRATTACSTAAPGTACIQVYEDSGEQLREQESLHAWGQRIDRLLNGDELFLRCQMVAPLRQEVAARPYYEVLLGLRDDSGEVVSPQPFVEAVEFWKRSRDLDLWVIEHTFAWIHANPAVFENTGGFSINLSALSMSDDAILAALHRQLGRTGAATAKIMFEITETATVGNYDAAREFIRQIRQYGCRFCIDDFGSGNASYGYLRNLRTDTLKIDGTFVKDLVDDPDLSAMVKSMNDIGHSLGMKTVAEYVATPEILALVRAMGVDYAQGFEIAKPIPIDDLRL